MVALVGGGRVHGIIAARLVEMVVLPPAADGQQVRARLPAKLAEQAAAPDVIFGGALGNRRAARAADIGSPPQAHAMVAVIIGRQAAVDRVAERRIEVQRGEIILPQAGRVIIDVVEGAVGRRKRRAGARRLGDRQRQREVVADIVVAQAEAADHVERQILIVGLAAIGEAEGSGQRRPAHVGDDLGVDHMMALLADALPLVHAEEAVAQIGAHLVAAGRGPQHAGCEGKRAGGERSLQERAPLEIGLGK